MKKAAPAEPRQDRLLAVLLEGVVVLERATARRQLERSSAPPRLVNRALRLLRASRVPDAFLESPADSDRLARAGDPLPSRKPPGS